MLILISSGRMRYSPRAVFRVADRFNSITSSRNMRQRKPSAFGIAADWIIQNYNDVREPYARSMLCLVLGFRASTDVIPFLVQQVDAFERQFPDKSFEQGPLMALYEIRARFRTV